MFGYFMFARTNNDGVSVNESALCIFCTRDNGALMHSYQAWEDAEDTTHASPAILLVDNPDAVCCNCGNSIQATQDKLDSIS